MRFESTELKKIFDKIRELNRKNSVLCEKFGGDTKYAILFKNNQPTGRVSDNLPLYNLLSDAKSRIDGRLANSQKLLESKGYFRRAVGEDVYETYDQKGYKLSPAIINKLVQNTADEYLKEYQGE